MPSPLAGENAFPWIVRERVGAGSSAIVYRATHATSGEVAALKVATGPGALRREAELLARLSRRWGPRLLDVGGLPGDALGAARGACFLATEWVEGRALDPVGLRGDRERVAAVVAHSIGRALAELHEAGVRHGDVKPANIVLTTKDPAWDVPVDRGATLIDLGLAVPTLDAPLTGGTPRYLAPEARGGPLACGSPADLYAAGLVLAEILEPGLARAEDLVMAATRWEPSSRSECIQWVRALLAPAPGGRPPATWLADRAARFMGLRSDMQNDARARELQVKRVYLTQRARELEGGAQASAEVTGLPRAWLDEASAWATKLGDIADVARPTSKAGAVGPLGPLGKLRWVMALVGPAAASWGPALEALTEAQLGERMVDLAAAHAPAGWTLDDVTAAVGVPRAAWEPGVGEERAARIARELARPVPDARAVAMAEDDVARGVAPQAIALGLATSLLRAGQSGRAFACLAAVKADEADALRAEIARRRGDRAEADRFAKRASKSSRAAVRAQGLATLSRLAWDAGDTDGAARLLEGAQGAPAAEVRALIAYRRGAFEAGLAGVEAALLQSRDDDASARLEGVRGMLAHARGDAETSVLAFARATELSARAGAVLEEATYLTGEAAAAMDAGAIGRALESARRAALLWERLGRPRDAARAWLTVAVAYATVGASHAADDAAREAELRARESGDTQAAVYALLPRIEVRPPGDDEAHALAVQAWGALGTEDGATEDRVRAAARCLVWAEGVLDASRVAELDTLAAAASAPVQWEWWGARAAALVRARARNPLVLDGLSEDRVQRTLVALLETKAPLAARGPALDAAAHLAAERGDGDIARRLELARGAAASALRDGTPGPLRSSLAQVPWARLPETTADDVSFAPAQIEMLESIVRALATRDNLRALLTQVLDTMVLWTGVERGLLLLRAPDGRLVPRAARNLARRDLHKEQLALSQTIARRALETGEAVIATDALASMGDVHASVHALRLRSVLAVPLMARGEALGVVYLDDRARRGAFGARELAWVRVVASQAAMAIVDARDQTLLRRAARRAERASRKLEGLLAARDAELDATRIELDRTREARESDPTRFKYDGIVGRSEPMRVLLRLVDKVTASDVPLLISGESGTGKELVARAVHENGARARKAFVSENCAAVPEQLLESTLFGHVRGAFTGASSTRAGLFDVADGGTLFLDEIGDMPPGMQVKLLRVLQDGEIRAVGGERTRRVDVRILGATHRDLEAMVRAGTFREDLFYRLNVISMRVPSLRERRDDIPILAAYFVEKHGAGRKLKITRGAMDRLTSYPWPGNVRQLENELRRAIVLADDRIDEADLSADVARGGPSASRGAGLDLRTRVDALESELVREAMKKTGGNQTKAAEILGLSRFGLQKMIKRLAVK